MSKSSFGIPESRQQTSNRDGTHRKVSDALQQSWKKLWNKQVGLDDRGTGRQVVEIKQPHRYRKMKRVSKELRVQDSTAAKTG